MNRNAEVALADLKGKVEGDDSAVEERLSKLAAGMFERLSGELATKEKEWAEERRVVEGRMRTEVKETVDEAMAGIVKEMGKLSGELREEAKQRDLMIEGSSQAFTLGVEKRIRKSVEASEVAIKKVEKEVRAGVEEVRTLVVREREERRTQVDRSKSEVTESMRQENEEIWRGMSEGDAGVREEVQRSMEVAKGDMLEHMARVEREAKQARALLAERGDVEEKFAIQQEMWKEALEGEQR